MRPVVVAWVTAGGAARFEASVPLRFNLRRAAALGFSAATDVVFLHGMNLLPAPDLAQLRAGGCVLHDAEPVFRAQVDRFAALARFGAFERNCFLRWPVLAELFPGEPLLHLDGDVVYNEAPATLARLLAGRTFVLQGCPALVALHDRAWLERYAGELRRFADDVAGYSAAAWEERAGWEESARSKWAGTRDRPIISSDQDLISHLIHTDRLPQASPAEVIAAAPGHVFFENPLLIGDLVPERPLAYRRVAGIDYLGERRVALWHLQTDWCRYLARFRLREGLGWRGRRRLAGPGHRDGETLLHAGLRKLSGGRWSDRAGIIRRFFTDGDWSAVLADETWWQPGVFPARAGFGLAGAGARR